MTSAGPVPDFDTVILAGGSAARMDGADKPGLEVGGRPLLVSVAHAAAVAGTRRLVIVGPPRPGAVQAGLAALAADRSVSLSRVLEDPPGGGPVAGLRRGLVEVAAPWLALLAADLPFLTATQLTDMLLTAQAHRRAATGVVLTDAEGRPQWLISCWRTGDAAPGTRGLRRRIAARSAGAAASGTWLWRRSAGRCAGGCDACLAGL